MSSTDDLRADRLKKRDALIAAGKEVYPASTKRTHTLSEVVCNFDALQADGVAMVVVGRVMAMREHGAIAFADLFDGTDRLQAFFSKEFMAEADFEQLVSLVSTADFIEVTGTAYLTKRGVQAIAVTSWAMLTKALASMPTEHFGLKDDDERLRKRYLDIMLNPDVAEMFKKKSAYWRASRRFLEDKGFLEVHTPTLETTTGGAEATPFTTHHNDFDLDVYLRICVGELWQKRLMAAGIPRTFEVGRAYRNEGTSPDHLQEFTNIEIYAAYLNFDDGIKLLEEHIQYVLDEAFAGQRVFNIKGFTVDFTGPFGRIDYVDTVAQMTGINVVTASYEEILAKVVELGIKHEGTNRERLTDTLWKYCRKQIAGPVWLTGHPTLVSPLSKENPQKPGTVLRGQLVIAGTEFNNCFAELNDPEDQRQRFEAQADLLAEGDTEAMMPDWEFVEMLEHGMPPTFGAATLGERFFAILVDKPIRETQYFPLMRPKIETEKIAEGGE
jgi:lysyl-tRNA synthetase, class II